MASSSSPDPGSPRTLADIALPDRARRVLEDLEQSTASALARQLQVVLQEAEKQLDRLVGESRGHRSEHRLFEALHALRRQAPALIPRFTRELGAELSLLHAPRVSRRLEDLALPSQGLGLVDTSEMDEGAVLGGIASRGDARNSLALQLLGYRFGVLAGAPAFDAEHLPLGPHALCQALRNAATSLALPLDARLVVYKQFDKVAMAHLPSLLEALNSRLAAQGILPHLSFVPVRARPAIQDHARVTEEGASDSTRDSATEAISIQPTSRQSPEAVRQTHAGFDFGNLQDLLERRRALLAKLRPDGNSERVRATLGQDEVLGALRRMRTIGGRTGTPAEIRQTLLAQARQVHGHGAALDRSDNDVFELLGLFFGQLQRELRNGSPGDALIDRLKLPLLQLALRDTHFFVDPGHPARKLLDAVSLAGARWLAEDDLDPQWLGLLQRAAGTVQEDPDACEETFVSANHALQGGLQASARKSAMAERRMVDAARGREKLELARLRAAGEIDRLVAGRQLPRFHSLLLEQAWTDVLSLVLLRSGEDSEAWRELREATISIINASTGPVAQAADPAFLDRLQQALAQVGYHAEDAGAIARLLGNGCEEDADLASRTELLVQLKARARLGEGALACKGTALPARNERDQAAFERLGAIGEGCWIELHDPVLDRMVRRRLAWTSTRTGQALLLNRRSLRIEGHDLDALARRLVAADLKLVDDTHPAELAWQGTLANLQRIADDQPDLQEPGNGQ